MYCNIDTLGCIISLINDYKTFKSISLVNKLVGRICKDQTQNPIRSLMRFWKIKEEQLIYQNPWLEPEINKNLKPIPLRFWFCSSVGCQKILESSGVDTYSLDYFCKVLWYKKPRISPKYAVSLAIRDCYYDWTDVVYGFIKIGNKVFSIEEFRVSDVLAKRFGK